MADKIRRVHKIGKQNINQPYMNTNLLKVPVSI